MSHDEIKQFRKFITRTFGDKYPKVKLSDKDIIEFDRENGPGISTQAVENW